MFSSSLRSIYDSCWIIFIHFNSRSLYVNITSIREYLDTFSQPFNIEISDTWINKDRELDFDMDGYELSYINRQNKGGGWVDIYVDKTLNFKVMDSITIVVGNVLECISIEICKEKSKNLIISCFYRVPGSNIEVFKDWMKDIFVSLKRIISNHHKMMVRY